MGICYKIHTFDGQSVRTGTKDRIRSNGGENIDTLI